MVENKYSHELNSVNMRQGAPLVFQVRILFVRRSIKVLASAKAGRFSLLPQGNGFISMLAIWMQGKEVLNEKSTERPCENGRNHESPGRNNVLFAEIRFSLVEMKISPVDMTFPPVEMKFLPVEMGNLPVEITFRPVEMRRKPSA
jgi:hypothetical protein